MLDPLTLMLSALLASESCRIQKALFTVTLMFQSVTSIITVLNEPCIIWSPHRNTSLLWDHPLKFGWFLISLTQAVTCCSFQDHQWIRGPNILLWLLLLLDSRKGFQYPFGSSELTCWLSSKEITKNSEFCYFVLRRYLKWGAILQLIT